jgi:undecaprenyl-diphosphatase
MSEFLKAVLLGIIQGLTEFLPVSSSGHLEIAKYFLDTDFSASDSLLMSVVLHAATAISTIVVFRKEILEIFRGLISKGWNPSRKFALMVIISMIPAALVGVLWEDQLSAMFDGKVLFVAFMLLITGALLLFSDYAANRQKEVGYKHALIVGMAQAVALLPGISRSGATISTALILGIDKEKAASFSFLMVLPLILGKMGKDIMDGSLADSAISAPSLIGGFLAAFLAGVLACIWMVRLVKKSKLRYFAIYCFVLATLVILTFYL